MIVRENQSDRPSSAQAEGASPACDATRGVRVGGRPLLAGLALVSVGVAVGAQADGEIAQAALAGAMVLPLMWLAGLVQVGATSRWARIAAWAWLWLILAGLAGFGVLLVAQVQFGASGERLADDVPPAAWWPVLAALVLSGAGLLLGILLAASGGWAGAVRRLGGHVDRHGAAHALGSIGLIVFCVVSFAPLAALGGEAPFLLILAEDPEALSGERGDTGELLDTYYQLAWTVPLAFLLVGVPIRRGLRAGLDRLGIRPLRPRDLPLALVLTLALYVVGWTVDEGVVRVWDRLEWPVTDGDLVDTLFSASLTPLGAVASAFAAGFGEELLVRGALQPRFGWFLPNLAFVAGHAYQYGPDALLSVFTLGAMLAGIRARWNTSVAIAAHVLYDLLLFMGAALDWPGF